MATSGENGEHKPRPVPTPAEVFPPHRKRPPSRPPSPPKPQPQPEPEPEAEPERRGGEEENESGGAGAPQAGQTGE
jgi:hypothetical protein